MYLKNTSYTAEDEDILDAEAAYMDLEENLRDDLEHIEVTSIKGILLILESDWSVCGKTVVRL